MADPEMDEDLFADLYDGEADDPPQPASKPAESASAPVASEPDAALTQQSDLSAGFPSNGDASRPTETEAGYPDATAAISAAPVESMEGLKEDSNGDYHGPAPPRDDDNDRPIMAKEDGSWHEMSS
ncbi:hypothetical protein K431DRAFT_291809 [Polychaeton citri CBS 116435]|uniref:Uncharacterized protein n=1 Tax=Polychaeton citri CBS 116435 TaxID=1314669 RepID=A0A9P4UT23_9PEZI|nr:hypothetical protein K431DRAFT_291809 [Polychaeton citri CBS 116435]